MNANELADELKYTVKVFNMNTDMDTNPLIEAATMLRQQQTEIKALKDEISTLRYEKSSGVYDDEPVAWMAKDYDGIKTDFYMVIERRKLPDRLYETAIPLYTHPAKTLTDEEIRVVWYGHPEFKDGLGVDPIPFARAILRKAQEK